MITVTVRSEMGSTAYEQIAAMMMMMVVMMVETAMIAIMAHMWQRTQPWSSAAGGHKGESLTSDFSPISPTSQVLIDSINRKTGRERESPDAGAFRVKTAYVMTCSLTD